MTYRPLPVSLEIRKSEIDGLGLFATQDIPENTELGITHVKDSRFENGYIRTPLGGFFNHSENPNCEAYPDGDFIRLRSKTFIRKDEELLATYWLYDMKEINNESR
jgi:hypothetical protein